MNNSDETLVLLATLHVVTCCLLLEERAPCLERRRLDWAYHAQLLLNEGQFSQYYRMSFRSFERLVQLLAPLLEANELQSRRRTGVEPISPVNKVQMCLSWLAGYSYHPVRMLSGVSTSTFYSSVHDVMNAIQKTEELQLHFPVSEAEQRHSAREFSKLSNFNIMRGCVGAIDGWLCPIQVPRRREVGRVSSFFSGHYQRYGVNVQACVDHHCRFTAISCSSPGGMGDSLAFTRWSLSQIAETFPKGLYLVGDNAYTNSNTLLTPFTKPQTTTSSRDSYNFHLSQLRIRVEMAFGLLVNKWRIFKRPLRVGMKSVGKVVHVACMLHNWCINERLSEDDSFDATTDADLTAALARASACWSTPSTNDMTVPPNNASAFRRLYDSTQLAVERRTESELLRNAMVACVGNTVRPSHNVNRADNERKRKE